MTPIETVQSEADVAGHVLEKLVGWIEHVELSCPLILPEFYHMLCQTFKPWLCMIDNMTSPSGTKVKMDDFPILINSEILSDNDLFWTKAVSIRLTHVPEFFQSILHPLCDAIKASEILRHSRIWHGEHAPCLFEKFEKKFKKVQKFQRIRPEDSVDSHRVFHEITDMFEDTEQFGIMSDWVRKTFKDINPVPVPELDKVDDLIRSGFDWQNYWDGTRSMERILEPVRNHLLVKTGNFLKILRNFKGENERSFESYIHAVTSFYLGQTGDILSDISHIIADGVNDRASYHIKIAEARESCTLHWLGDNFRVGFDEDPEKSLDRQINIEINIPPPAKFIINDESMAKYQDLYRLNLRLRLAQISLERDREEKPGKSKKADNDPISSFVLEKHLRMIIGALFSFIQSGVILPLLQDFNKKMEEATTFDEIFTAHRSMLDLICSRSLVTVKGHPHMSKLINRVITLAINFKDLKNKGELDAVYKDFVRHCTDIKVILEALATKSSQMADWLDFLSDVFYYTPERNQIQGEEKPTKMMSLKKSKALVKQLSQEL